VEDMCGTYKEMKEEVKKKRREERRRTALRKKETKKRRGKIPFFTKKKGRNFMPFILQTQQACRDLFLIFNFFFFFFF